MSKTQTVQEVLDQATKRPWEEAGMFTVHNYTIHRYLSAKDWLIAHHAVNKFEAHLEAFREIAKCEAPFKRDRLEFANNVIAKHVAIAEEAIRQAEEVEG